MEGFVLVIVLLTLALLLWNELGIAYALPGFIIAGVAVVFLFTEKWTEIMAFRWITAYLFGS